MNFKKDFLIDSNFNLFIGSTKEKTFKIVDPTTSSTLKIFNDDFFFDVNKIVFFSKYNNFLIQSSNKNILSYYNFSLNKPFHKSSTIDKITALESILDDFIIAGTSEGYIKIFLGNNGNLLSKFKNFDNKIIKIHFLK